MTKLQQIIVSILAMGLGPLFTAFAYGTRGLGPMLATSCLLVGIILPIIGVILFVNAVRRP